MKYLFMIVGLLIIAGCGGNQAPESQFEENDGVSDVSDVSISFGILDVVTRAGVIQVKGEAKTDENSFYYILEYEGSLIVEETEVQLNDEDSEWRTFSFETTIEGEEFENKDGLLLTLYLKDGETKVNPNYIPVDLLMY